MHQDHQKQQASIPISKLSQVTKTVGKPGFDDGKNIALLAATMLV